MELVRGIPITWYCEQQQLATRERLDLFIKVCQAIQHAHQKGIIHRDIEPNNILVTLHDGVPVPKVIDFGIAKATEGRLTDAAVYTHLHQFIGTPAYMSPEQAEMSGLDIDTRSDIYSLGVLLYELLTGQTPFDVRELLSSGLDAMRKTIREQEPVRPSTLLTQELATVEATRRGGIDARSHESSRRRLQERIHHVKGDLDWIVMKCLEKDRQRRYATANGLAADLKRHLDHEPVVARPPSAAYRLQKTVRRHKIVFAAGALLVVILSTGIGFSSWLAIRAQTMKAHYQAALHFIHDVLSQASPGFQPDRDLKVSDLLERITGQLDGPSTQPPLVEAFIRQILGSIYTELGEYAYAVKHYDRAHELQAERLGRDHAETLRSQHGLAMAHWWSGNMAQAEPLARQGLDICRRVFGNADPLTLQFMKANVFTVMALAQEPWAEVERLFTEAFTQHREVLGPDDARTLRLAYGIALGHASRFQGDQAISGLLDAVERAQRTLSEKHPLRLSLMALLAHAYLCEHRFEEARELASQARELREAALGEKHPMTLTSIVLDAHVQVAQGSLIEARPHAERALQLSQDLQIEKSPFLAWQMAALGWAYFEQNDVKLAEDLMSLALQAVKQHRPNANPLATLGIRAQAGAFRLAQGRDAEAAELLHEAFAQAEKCWPDSFYLHYLASLRGESLARRAEYAAAEPLLLQGYQGLQLNYASIPSYLNPARRVQESLERLVNLYEAWDKRGQAAEWKKKLEQFAPTDR